MTCGVYKIVCKTTNKIYIGSSHTCETRFIKHLSALKLNKHHNKYLQNSYNKYGINNLCYILIEQCEEHERLDREQYYLDKYQSYNRNIGFNLCNKSYDGKSSVFDSSKEFLIIEPCGKRHIVKGLDIFSRSVGFKESCLRNIALGRAFQYNGWHCRYLTDSLDDWKNRLKWKKCLTKKIWIFRYTNGKVQITNKLYDYCKSRQISTGTIYGRVIPGTGIHKSIYKVDIIIVENYNIEKWR